MFFSSFPVRKVGVFWRGVLVLAFLLSFGAQGALAQIVINEIHYEPADKTDLSEFIELYNAGHSVENLSGWSLQDGVRFVFPEGTLLAAGSYLVVGESTETLKTRFGVVAYGPYEGNLSNEGEKITLRDAAGQVADRVEYKLGFPWPTASGGDGCSIELIHPSLDNDLGGSWRASGMSGGGAVSPVYLIKAQETGWRYRKGTEEPSSPTDAWRKTDFVEDATWLTGQTSIGYADNDDNTVLDDMINNYTTVYLRKTFTIASAADIPAKLRLRIYVDDGCIVWLNNHYIGSSSVSQTDQYAHDGTAINHEAVWEEFELSAEAIGYLQIGVNVIAIQALNTTIVSSDFSIDMELYTPGFDPTQVGEPTPGRRNSVWSETPPPQIRQVDHAPRQPHADQPVAITAKITAPGGAPVQAQLHYQIVKPGAYIPAYLPLPYNTLLSNSLQPLTPNPDFEDPKNWTTIPMSDKGADCDVTSGDGIFTAQIPGQDNRTLIRYRITASSVSGTTETLVTVPYEDDEALNFACYVYNGVPPYVASLRSVHPAGAGHVYTTETMTSLPVYSLVTRAEDFSYCYAYTGYQIPKEYEEARGRFNWEGAFVYRGEVYDHIFYRLRQSNGRYQDAGKRGMRFRFNRAHNLQAYDDDGNPYPTKWRTLDVSKLFDNRGVGNVGLVESMNNYLSNLIGVPAPYTHYFHFRVVDGADEVPVGTNGQYYGDFYGLFLAMEDYDTQFMKAHHLPDGNLYKLKDTVYDGNKLKRHQGRNSVTDDSDFQNIHYNMNPSQTEQYIRDHVRLDLYYRYRAICEAIRHRDFVPADSHLKNRTWFFEPSASSPYGKLWDMLYDSDSTWGPDWYLSGWDYVKNAISGNGGKPALDQELRNYIREFRDLVWQPDVIGTMLDDFAGRIRDFQLADRDRWRMAPADAGNEDKTTLAFKTQDMKNFAFTGWTPSVDGIGDPVPTGGRASYLDSLANTAGDFANLPGIPSITSQAPTGYPADALTFHAAAFRDPQGANTFAAMRWRVGETFYDPATRERRWEFDVRYCWVSDEITSFTSLFTVPSNHVEVGRTYRVRLQMKDTTGRWSHWSAPITFTVGKPSKQATLQENLRISELMYHPYGENTEAYEFVELQNTHAQWSLDLGGVAFTQGVSFVFPEGVTLKPQEYLLVVNQEGWANLDDFRAHYGLDKSVQIVGPYGGKLSNSGETVQLKTAVEGIEICTFEYKTTGDWPQRADGKGCSLEIRPGENLTDLAVYTSPKAWRSSVDFEGSPGRAGRSSEPSMIVNEVFASSVTPVVGNYVELYNVTTGTLNLAGWWISDSDTDYFKYRLTTETQALAHNYLALPETLFNPTPATPGPRDFHLNAAHGGELYLLGRDADNRYWFADHVQFGASAPGEPFGRCLDGTVPESGESELYPLTTATLASKNGAPRVGPILLSEVHYNPGSDPAVALQEFVEIYNPTSTAIDLTGWRLRKAVDYDFTTGTLLPAKTALAVLTFDPAAPENAALLTSFCNTYSIPTTSPLVGPYGGRLDNSGEHLQLQRPGQPPADEPGFTPHLIEDEMHYSNKAPWPDSADGGGDSLNRVGPTLWGIPALDWMSANPTPGAVVFFPAAPPQVTLDPVSLRCRAGKPTLFRVEATGTPPLRYQWTRNGVAIPGAHLPTFAILKTHPLDAGEYACLIVNPYGSAQSQSAGLIVDPYAVTDPASWWLY
ncbi:MAG TPA: lamin tail domain-containing protein [Candidatus Sumerlaeota bacterium]|nr:lamin tail domain-containing protein [Candidatus Sumerlaeota bacterium]